MKYDELAQNHYNDIENLTLGSKIIIPTDDES